MVGGPSPPSMPEGPNFTTFCLLTASSMHADMLRILVMQCNQRHCEHHMFANVPCYNLAELHKEVAHDMPTPRTLVGAWKEMRATWNKQQEDPDYEFDTPVPAPSKAKTDAMEAQRKEAGHLGDIAPATL